MVHGLTSRDKKEQLMLLTLIFIKACLNEYRFLCRLFLWNKFNCQNSYNTVSKKIQLAYISRAQTTEIDMRINLTCSVITQRDNKTCVHHMTFSQLSDRSCH